MKKKQEQKQKQPEPAPKAAVPLLSVGETFKVMLRDGWHPARVVRVLPAAEVCVLLVDDHREISFGLAAAVNCRNNQPK